MLRISRVSRIALLAVVLTMAGVVPAFAEDRLDATFSADGQRQVSFVAGGEDRAFDVTTTTTDRIVVAGAAGGSMSVARIKVNGTLDTSFSGDGKLLVDLGGDDIAFGVARQGDKILLAGVKDARAAVVRLNANGTRDTTFSGDGIRTQAVPNATTAAWTVVADGGSGRVLAGGYALDGGSEQVPVVARYRANGTLDATFFADGIGVLPGSNAFVVDLVPRSQGRVLVLVRGSGAGSVLMRLRSDGTPDPGFGGGEGTVNLPSGSMPDAMAVRNGRIVVLLYEGGAPVVRRYLLDGSPDTGFGGGDGQVAIVNDVIGDTSPVDVAVQPDSSIVIAASNGNLQAFRVTPTGVLDETFNDGIPLVELGGAGDDEIAGITVDSLGRIVLAGTLELPGSQEDPFIARFIAD
jgi:uncharacterized delta-60 repeat protein